jgi:hypothetical protein
MMEADLIVDLDTEVAPPMEEDADVVANADAEAEALPEIEIDEWIDLEDQWEKDYFFLVFTDDELYHHAYALYYHVLKDEHQAQHLARQQVASLKATLKRMQERRETLPAHVVPVFRGSRMDLEDDFGKYKAFYGKLAKMPYQDAQRMLQSYYLNTLKALNANEPFLQLHERRELQLNAEPDVAPMEEPEQDGGAPRKKNTGKPGKQAKPVAEPPTPANPTNPNQRMVYLSTDETPLPIDGVVQYDRMPAESIPELYLKERVEYIDPVFHSHIPLESLDWKKPSSLTRAVRESTSFPFENHVLKQLQELPSPHTLQVHLATFGFRLDTLTSDQYKALIAHLETLNRQVKQTKSKRTQYLWEPVPVAGWKPSDRSPFVALKPWMETSQAALEKQRRVYQDKLGLLEKHSDIFNKHPGMVPDIYDLAVRIRGGQIDIEEAIATLQAIHTEAKTQLYADFLRDLLQFEWNPMDIETAIHAWNRMDASVETDKHSLIHSYIHDHAFQTGSRTFLIEDQIHQGDTVVETGGDEEAERDIGEGGEEPMGDFAEDTNMDVFEPSESLPAPDEEQGGSGGAGTEGQKEVWMYVRRMMRELHQSTELPFPEESMTLFVFQHAPMLHQRLSIAEQLIQQFPEIPAKDLNILVEQKLFVGATEDEAAIRKAYKDAYADLKKAIVETFVYALTWWVVFLQDQYIRHGRPWVPSYTACLPVWAFYGTPMSSSDEKGMARYLICVALALLENDPDHSSWSVLRNIPEKKLLDRVYKNAQLPVFADVVQFLKQQWRDRWKEIARKEKDMEIRLETLERTTDNPKEYLKMYLHLMLRLPTLLANAPSHKKETMVVPVANSCCFQPLNARFQPFGDFKDAGLYTHQKALERGKTTKRPGRTGELARVVLNAPPVPGVDSTTFFKELMCRDAYTLPPAENTVPDVKRPGVSKAQWNQLCSMLDEPEWRFMVPDDDDEGVGVGETSTSHIRRAIQTLSSRLSKNKRDLDRWDTWVSDRSTWEEKIRLLTFIHTTMKDECILYETAKEAIERAMDYLKQWIALVESWTPGDSPEAPMELVSYVLHRALLLPDTDTLNPKTLQTIVENRFQRVLTRVMKREIPTQRAIQDYYATVREKLKVDNLALYKTKTIQEIQELQDAKRLKLAKLLDTSLKSSGVSGGSATEATDDDRVEAEGLAEHRVYASWNADEMDPERLDP